MNIFVTGTDTDVGKTIVSAWICYQTGASYWKPIQTGSDSDSKVIKQLSPQTQIINEAYKLKAPLSPYDAASIEKIDIDITKITNNILSQTLIEGTGGILVPIAKNFRMIDLAEKFNTKTLIVARSKLGFLNHIFLTVEVLQNRNIPIIGIILNGETDDSLIRTIEHFSGIKVLQILSHSENIKQMIRKVVVPNVIKEIF
ncbi:MAG: dethiobiotin synthase [Puniceicoccales bacterium]|jgi:dethiobiotin synthase|nr:dethiobiotin synthase [Puniceicoccales bacterium]